MLAKCKDFINLLISYMFCLQLASTTAEADISPTHPFILGLALNSRERYGGVMGKYAGGELKPPSIEVRHGRVFMQRVNGLAAAMKDLSYVDFSFACLKNVFFSRANLHCAKFRGRREFSGANLRGVLLAGANLQSANLQGKIAQSGASKEGSNREEPKESVEFAGRKEMTVLPYCGYPA
ncbi:FH protein interacting protein FIP2, partial [Tanacetum coccineum]